MNFKDAYKQDLDYYGSSTSAEKLKEYAMQEERRRDLKALPVLFGIILIGLICWWLSLDREEYISNTYEGIVIQYDDEGLEGYIAKIDGTITYDDKIFDDISAIDILVTLEDSSGNIVYEQKTSCTISEPSSELDFIVLCYTLFEPEPNFKLDTILTGYLYFTKDFEEIFLMVKDSDIHFAGPAKNTDEAMKICRYWFPMAGKKDE